MWITILMWTILNLTLFLTSFISEYLQINQEVFLTVKYLCVRKHKKQMPSSKTTIYYFLKMPLSTPNPNLRFGQMMSNAPMDVLPDNWMRRLYFIYRH